MARMPSARSSSSSKAGSLVRSAWCHRICNLGIWDSLHAARPVAQRIECPKHVADREIIGHGIDGRAGTVIRANGFEMRQKFGLERLRSGGACLGVRGYVDLQPGGLKRATFAASGSCSMTCRRWDWAAAA